VRSILGLVLVAAVWGQGAGPAAGVGSAAGAGKASQVTPGAGKAPAAQPGATAAAPAPGSEKAATPTEGAVPAKPAETFESSMAKQRAAMVVQRESVRRQVELAAQWRGSTAGIDTMEAECDPIATPELTPLITRAAQAHQLEPGLLSGVIEQESGFRPCAVSVKGAKGLMQLMPVTIEQFKVNDAFDPGQNIEAGATYLKQLLDRYKGDLKLALAAYNAGPANVDKTGGIPDIKETQDYVAGIMKKLK